MKNLLTTCCLITLMWPSIIHAQSKSHRCGAMEHLDMQLLQDPGLAQRMQAIERHTETYTRTLAGTKRGVITIPVVFHVVYNTGAQNLADSYLNSQIDILNEDFRKMNADTTAIPGVFTGLAADTDIEFVLAKRDPAGNPTTGITRTSTTVTSWSSNDLVKYTASGGKDAWPTDQYLNFWVCNLGGGLLGYAQFPGGDIETDGVVCNYLNVGNNPAGTPYDLGRTATHEIGHWLNLRHIWGDANCGNDFVDDTPTQQTSNGGCPTFPHVTACSGNAPNGDLFVNYMDYCYDNCLVMFTTGQKTRMNAVMAPGGPRYAITTSLGGIGPGACTDPPTAGAAQASSNSVCAGSLVSLSLNGSTHGTGQSYQWQVSTDNINWSNLTGETSMTALVNVSEDAYYRCELSCGASTVQSASVQVTEEAYIINSFPHLEDFDLLPLDCGWKVENTNSDATSWDVLANPTYAYSGANSMYYTYNSASAADDWVFIPAAQVSPNNQYRLRLRQRVYGSAYPEAMQIWVGTAPNSSSMETMLFNNSNLTNTSYALRTSSYHQPSEFGTIYFGIKCNSTADQAFLFIDNVEVQENVVCVPGTANTVSSSADCIGTATGGVNVSVSGGVAPYSYSWSNGSTDEDLVGAAAGVYTVTVTDNSGCITVKSASVSEPTGILASTSYTSLKCFNSSSATMRVNGTGGTPPYTYSWNTTPVQSTAEVNNVAAGSYEVTITDNNGCTTSRQIQINEPTELLPFVIQNSPAVGDINLLISGGVAPYSFIWSNGATTEDLNAVAPGFYFVYMKDKNSCAKLKVVNLSYPNNRVIEQPPFAAQNKVETTDANAGFTLYPNPANNIIHIFSNEDIEQVTGYRILNLMGEVVRNVSLNGKDFTGEISVPIHELMNGIYLIQIDDQEMTTMKFHKL